MTGRSLNHFITLVVVGLILAMSATVTLAEEGGSGPAVGDVAFQDGFEDWHDANQRVENDWETWNLHDCQIENVQGDFDALCGVPEYKQANPMDAYPYRKHSGQNAQQYFTPHRGHHAGVWRRFEAEAGAVIEVHAWGEAWSSDDNDPHAYDAAQEVRMQIGVDPNGGSNPASPSVVWGEPANPPNEWQKVPPVEVTVGDTGQVSVFLSSNPKYTLAHNDIYWDDVSAVYKSVTPNLPDAESEEPEASGGDGASSDNSSGSGSTSTEESVPAPDPILEGMVEDQKGSGHPGQAGDARRLWVPLFAVVIGAYYFVPHRRVRRVACRRGNGRPNHRSGEAR